MVEKRQKQLEEQKKQMKQEEEIKKKEEMKKKEEIKNVEEPKKVELAKKNIIKGEISNNNKNYKTLIIPSLFVRSIKWKFSVSNLPESFRIKPIPT